MIVAMLSAMTNPAGGLAYHWRALRHGDRWRPFLEPLHAWLDAWQPASPHLLLVGPSAGWCLPDALFRRFAALDVLEPDPLAWGLLSRRLRALGRPARRHAVDCLAPDPGALAPLARDFAEHAILFCNVLGQARWLHPALDDPDRLATWRAGLAAALDGREWATFHDRLSGTLRPRLPEPAASDEPLADERLATLFYDDDGELLSHGTDGLFPGRPRRWFAWEIAPGRHHLIEAVRHD